MDNNGQDFKDKILLEVHKDIGHMKEIMAEIKVDLKEHIKRTNLLEAKVSQLEKVFYMAQGATTFATAAFAILKYWFKVI